MLSSAAKVKCCAMWAEKSTENPVERTRQIMAMASMLMPMTPMAPRMPR
jgi:hypothetical protein